MKMRILKRQPPVLLLLVLSACSSPQPTPVPVAYPAPGDPMLAALVREQADPPPPLLEHPGKPPANGYVWIAGRWDLVEGQYRWRAGNWSPPRPGYVWQPHVWRRVGDRWQQEGGRWEPDANSPPRSRKR